MRPAEGAPDFALMDATGTEVRLSVHRGKVILLNFWATWCWPCRTEIPWFAEFGRKYRDQGFVVIGVSMDEDGWRLVSPFLNELGVDYPVVIGNQDLAGSYTVDALPMTLLIDREGRIVSRHAGVVSKHDYENEIAALLRR
jgi:cytochrome c biogenesis protein CcmG/thiol:disulfide interchange protein DsbE